MGGQGGACWGRRRPAPYPARGPEPSGREVRGLQASHSLDMPSVRPQLSDTTAGPLVETLLPGPWTGTIALTIPMARLGYSNPSPALHSQVTCNRQTGPCYALLYYPGPSHPAGSTLGPFWSFPRSVGSSITRDASVKSSLLGSTHRGQGFGPLVASCRCHTMASGAHLPLKHGRRPLQAPCFSVAAVYFAIRPPWRKPLVLEQILLGVLLLHISVLLLRNAEG